MPTTSNFGWTTPADTDLVKDGAAAIRTLGNGIDTSFLDLKGGTTGQILSKASNTDLDFTWTAGGDITEVQAGTGISVASGTGPIPVVTNTVATAFDAAGDLVYGTGADTFTKLSLGTANQVLAVNSGATAPEWKTVGASGMTLVKRSTFTNVATTGTTFDGVFTSTYGSYLVVIENLDAATLADNAQLQYRLAGATKSNNYFAGSFINGSNSVSLTTLYSSTLFELSTDGYIFGQLFFQGSNIHGQISSQLNALFSTINGFVDSYAPDGFLLKSASSNINGTVAVYGLAK